MIVIFDTNIWMNELYLRSAAGSAVKLYVKRSGAVIALPEVIRLEVIAHLKADLTRSRDQAEKAHQRMLALFKTLKPISLPTDVQISDLCGRFFDESGLEYREIPFDLGSARDSFLRTIHKRSPSTGSQQFKDGVVWANCIELAAEDDVILVTADGDYYADKAGGPMAPDLEIEAAQCVHSIRLMSGLTDLLTVIKYPVTADLEKLTAAILEALDYDIEQVVEADELTRTPPIISATFFATEDPDSIYIEFELSMICKDETGEERGDALMKITGGCAWDQSDNYFSNIKPTEISLEYLDPSPITGRLSRYYRYAEGQIGKRNVLHTVRHKLNV